MGLPWEWQQWQLDDGITAVTVTVLAPYHMLRTLHVTEFLVNYKHE